MTETIVPLMTHLYSRMEEIIPTAKEYIAEIVKRQPDDSSYDDIVRALAFDLMVQRGLNDSEDRRTISNEEMKCRIKTWRR